MSAESAQVYVTKLAAARRLLRAAVRMYFRNEDKLAVHTVAAAAYGILAGLKTARGQSEAAFASETLMRGFLVMARDRARGELSPEVLNDPYTMKLLDDLVVRLKIKPDTDVSSIKFNAALDSQATAAYWRATNRASNFLKHADRDANAALPLSEVDCYGLLMKGMVSYESLAPDDLGLEGLVLQVHFLASHDFPHESVDPRNALVEKLRTMAPEERMAFSAFQLERERPDGID